MYLCTPITIRPEPVRGNTCETEKSGLCQTLLLLLPQCLPPLLRRARANLVTTNKSSLSSYGIQPRDFDPKLILTLYRNRLDSLLCVCLSAGRLMPCHTPALKVEKNAEDSTLQNKCDGCDLEVIFTKTFTIVRDKFETKVVNSNRYHLGYLSPYLLLRSFSIGQLSRPPPCTHPSQ